MDGNMQIDLRAIRRHHAGLHLIGSELHMTKVPMKKAPMKKAPLLLLLLLLSGQALADDAGLQRCRAITDWFTRLACYDGLPLNGEAPAGVGPAGPAGSAAKGQAPAGRAPAGQAPAAAAAGAAPTPQQQFGLEGRPKPAEEVVDTVTSTIPGHFEGWKPRALIELANGQIWRIADNSSRVLDYDNPKVTIRRGSLGSFYMDVGNDNSSPRVQRVH
jgi:hypothetical protein